MASLLFITHPEVMIDPAVDVRRWRLSAPGRSRMDAFSQSAVVRDVTAIWSSAETKAIEAAEILSGHLGIGVKIDEALGENDRSATGFVPPEQFEKLADAFFKRPDESVSGWERATDAQHRIFDATERILTGHTQGDIAIIAHGAVGTLLLCRYTGQPISRLADQPFQGHYWRADLPSRKIVHGWRPIAGG